MAFVKPATAYFGDPTKDQAISNAQIYIGKPDTDPEIVSNQVQVQAQQEDGSIVSISQPIATDAGGVPQYNGANVVLLVSGIHSLKVLDSAGQQKYYIPFNNDNDSAGSTFYYPNPNAVDQGVTGNNDTIKAYVDIIGTTDKATIYLRNNSASQFTDYLFSTSLTIPGNITIQRESGARIKDDVSGAAVTIEGPFVSSNDEAFNWGNGSGVLSFGAISTDVVYPEWFGDNLQPGITDMANSIQLADNLARTMGTGRVKFSSADYLIGSKVNKDLYTSWEGTLGTQIPQIGTNLVLGYNGTMIEVEGVGVQFTGNVGFSKMRLLGDLSLYTGGIGIDVKTVVRRQVYEDLYIYGFLSGIRGIIHESYFNRCFLSANIYSLNTTGGGADCFFNNCHFGSGLGATGVNGANGVRINNANNFRFSQCRFQVNEEGTGVATGHGGRIKNSTNIYFDNCYYDQNEGYGLFVIDSQDIFINGISAFDNGSAKANRAGVAVFASDSNDSGDVINFTYDGDGSTFTSGVEHDIANTRLGVQVTSTGTLPTGLSAGTTYYFIRVDADQFKLATTQQNALDGVSIPISGPGTGIHTLLGVIENFQIDGGRIYDRGNGYQESGISIIRSSAENQINSLRISSIDCTGVVIPIESPIDDWSLLGSGWRITDDSPKLDTEEITADLKTLQPWGASNLNSSSNKVDCTLSSGFYAGERKTIVMIDATNNSILTVVNHNEGANKTYLFTAVNETVVFEWNGNEWITIKNTLGPRTLENVATPSVLGGAGNDIWNTGGTTTISNFIDGYTGQILKILAAHTITISTGVDIFLSGGVAFNMLNGDTLTLLLKGDNKWYEMGRGDNS